ncbi:hypothetical protein DL764_010212 [Monosporascus ibericus]|uniref:CCHC-type domain-containing protein n=1 Tax=Monosporascus ibericus TaxID=155417 RepID=A0A4Q4ST70_9PEZI|nr:hypothetical protein DL764_010212 [Monosporascus ibericus]
MFLTAMENRANSWCKTMQLMLRQTDYSFQQLINDFNSEFYNRSGNKKKNGKSYNAQKGKGKGNNNNKDNKPVWNKNGDPLCFNCGKYGHLAKDCPKPQKEKNGKGKKGGGQGEKQFIPEGLRDVYRSSGGTFSAQADDQQLQDLMQWYNETLQKSAAGPLVAECPEATVGKDLGANVNITNNIKDFEKNTVLNIKSKGIYIITGGRPVLATSVRIVKWALKGPRGENNETLVKYMLYINGFPLKVFSGEIYYKRGGYLNKNTLVNPDGSQLTTINVPRRGFFLWLYGKPEPIIKAPESTNDENWQ